MQIHVTYQKKKNIILDLVFAMSVVPPCAPAFVFVDHRFSFGPTFNIQGAAYLSCLFHVPWPGGGGTGLSDL